MHRIDTPSATAENQFTEGSPTGGVPATVVSDDWLNDVQENICKVIEQAGLPLTKGRALDLFDAIRAIAVGGIGNGVLASTGGWFEIPYRDNVSGVSKKAIIQVGSGTTGTVNQQSTITLPIAFPNFFSKVIAVDGIGQPPSVETIAVEVAGLGTFSALRSNGLSGLGFHYIAIGG